MRLTWNLFSWIISNRIGYFEGYFWWLQNGSRIFKLLRIQDSERLYPIMNRLISISGMYFRGGWLKTLEFFTSINLSKLAHAARMNWLISIGDLSISLVADIKLPLRFVHSKWQINLNVYWYLENQNHRFKMVDEYYSLPTDLSLNNILKRRTKNF